MSSYFYRQFGYGVCLSDFKNIDIQKLIDLIQETPKVAESFNEWVKNAGYDIKDITLEELDDYDYVQWTGLGLILTGLIWENEKIDLLRVRDVEDNVYLLYDPKYPWDLSLAEQVLSATALKDIFIKYLSRITDEEIIVDYQDPECGG